ncbi:hypothetical protein [Caldimonas brevitalea]|uniref:Uncharacterized protein n=1 Tax=Caldimonas brevitalea TaxID=413882 RepID=A0A0G3BE13_9BURK|nr:hypothetical protein [Caldimonas brevitalea]AKJ27532.1 hypothetical protein AAW51_0841 [Caldimonas brevitalea]
MSSPISSRAATPPPTTTTSSRTPTTAPHHHHDTHASSSASATPFSGTSVRSFASAPPGLRSRKAAGGVNGQGSLPPRASVPRSSSGAASTANTAGGSGPEAHHADAGEGAYARPASASTTPPVTAAGKLAPEQAAERLIGTLAQQGGTHLASQAGAWLRQRTGSGTAAEAGGSSEALNLTSTLVSGTVSNALKKLVGERMKQHAAMKQNASDSATAEPTGNSVAASLRPKLMAAAKGMLAGVTGGLSKAALGAALTPVVQQGLEGQGVSEAVARPLATMAGAVLQGVVSAAADTAADAAGGSLQPRPSGGAGGPHQGHAQDDLAAALGGKAAEAVLNLGLNLPKGLQATLGQVMEHGSPHQKTAVSNATAWAGLNM